MKLTIEISKNGKFILIKNNKLNITGMGISFKEALQDFGQHMDHFKNYYTAISKEELTRPAIKIKEAFAKLLEE